MEIQHRYWHQGDGGIGKPIEIKILHWSKSHSFINS